MIRYKWYILSSTTIFSVIGIFIAYTTPNEYKAEVMLVAAGEQNQNNLGFGGQLGGLASLAGISSSGSSGDKVALAKELMNDWHFVDSFIKKYHIKHKILAAESWDVETQKLTYDEELFDDQSNSWRITQKSSKEPSDWKAFNEFKKRVIFRYSKDNPVIYVSLNHYSPHLAVEWLDLLITEMNTKIQNIDIKETQKSLTYLQDKVNETQVSELREVFFELMQQQLKKLMLAEIREEYILKKIGPIKTPQSPFKPKRLVIVLLSTFFGTLVSLLLIALLPGLKSAKRNIQDNA